ncbi:MAG: endolytic transglycosylase MltG [Candidatus Paceibacterota bacterium]|jgi:UPF0755 protein
MENFSSSNEVISLIDNLPKNSSFKKIIIFSAVSLIVFISLFYFLFLSAPLSFPKGKIINIEEGTSLRHISGDFKTNKIIRSRIAFEFFVIIYGGEKHLVLGDYLFEGKLPVFEVARIVSRGEHNLAPVKVTIPEGFNVVDIAESFSVRLSSFNKDKFLLEAKPKEGYLFPDTYFFFTDSNEEDVLKYMSDNFNKKTADIFSVSLSRSKKDIIIMASIIEKEAKGDSDREIISGILWNRISKGMPLQVDVAPDTYKTKGLPDSPICNPGLEAIKAAIYPKSSNYFYYLHDKNGIIHYAKTFEEHKQNKFKYLK